MSECEEQELFTCNVCGFLRTKAGFNYDNPVSDVDGGGNHCSECDDIAIACPECGLLGWFLKNENQFISIDYKIAFTTTGGGYDRVGLRCVCGCEFGAIDVDVKKSTIEH